MKLATAAQMQAVDRAAIEKYKIPSLDLMERAGAGVADLIKKKFPKKGLVAVIVGKGNNGGDGLVVARHLKEAGFDVDLYLTSPWTEFSADARINWDKLAGVIANVYEIATDADVRKLPKAFEKVTCIVDAIFGTGLVAEVRGKYHSIIEFINSHTKPVVSVDIPSGLSADTGQALGVAVRANWTVTFGMPKVGLVTNLGAEYSHEIEVVDIGIPKEVTDKADTGYYLISPDMFQGHFGKRVLDTSKGDNGRVLVIGGSAGKIGAGLLSSRAALRSGAGLVTYALPETAYTKFDTRAPEVMYEAVEDDQLGVLTKKSLPQLVALMKDKNVVALGPGLGTADGTKAAVTEIIKKAAAPIVIDADGLNCIADDLTILNGKKLPIVLTPHPGEMSRLTGANIKDIQNDRIKYAKELARARHVYVVLKGHRTVVATPEGAIYINPTGNPAMATAGTGDVLTGVIAGFIAQKIPVEAAVIAGVYIHGMAGDVAAEEVGERGVIASDLIGYIPKVIRLIK